MTSHPKAGSFTHPPHAGSFTHQPHAGSFRADLQHLEDALDPHAGPWSPWRTRAMIELGPRDTARFVEGVIGGGRLRVADVGCGNGYLALELARRGHAVTGVDPSEEALAVARRTAAGQALDLAYVASTFEAWDAPPGSHDAVVFNLSLHHVADLPGSVAKARRLLAPGGRIVCHEFAYDRLDAPTAAWLFQTEQQLYLTGLRELSHGADGAEPEAIAALRAEWTHHYADHGLHGFGAMTSALDASFRRDHFSWTPYLFMRAGSGIRRASPEQEAALFRFIKAMEAHLVETGRIQAVAFRFVGTPLAEDT